MEYSIYIDRDDYKQAEKEEQDIFIRKMLEQMGVPVEECWPENVIELTITEKQQLRELLNKFDIKIIDDKDGGVKIYVGKDLVAEWYKCTYDYKIDNQELDPSKKIYYQMNIKCWSLFEDDNESDDIYEDDQI